MKQRRFALDKAVFGMQRDGLMMILNQLSSVRIICFEGNKVVIVYNLDKVNATQIELALFKAGALMNSVWIERLKRYLVHNIEKREHNKLADY
ncbi:MAG: hypothetical protein Q9M17_07395 [Mariprofundus sp.]|nr:hypothetical protein [Mariprofundus sp.]